MGRAIKILVVEDDAVLRKLIASLFTKIASVHAVESGDAAIDFLKTQTADIIFSDVCMPNGNGVELLEWVQAHLPNPPSLVLVTGQAEITREEALGKGAYALVAKPFKVKDLTALAAEIIDLPKLDRPA